MYTVHATRKLLTRIGAPQPVGTTTTTALGDWYANALFWKPQVALFVNEQTLLPVLVPLAPASTLLDRFPDVLATALDALDVPTWFIERELTAMSEHRLATTSNRSVVGTMNEFAFLAGVYREGDELGGLLPRLSLRLAGVPCGALRTRHRFPDVELAALVAQHTP